MTHGEKFAEKIVELIVQKDNINIAIEGIVTDIDNILNTIPSIELERLQSLITNKMFIKFPELEFDIHCDTVDFLRNHTNDQVSLLQKQEKLKLIKFLRHSGMEYFTDITIQIDQETKHSLDFIDIIHSRNNELDLLSDNQLKQLQESENSYMKNLISKYLRDFRENTLFKGNFITFSKKNDIYKIVNNTYLRMYSID
ncbi:hypothetical protein HON22_00040 [Candidatus Peregrinibacteria bacterium]|jgi:hypothetical protein|nr:hypothetical protein [Candidatus Peregrinibacteria bacterium]